MNNQKQMEDSHLHIDLSGYISEKNGALIGALLEDNVTAMLAHITNTALLNKQKVERDGRIYDAQHVLSDTAGIVQLLELLENMATACSIMSGAIAGKTLLSENLESGFKRIGDAKIIDAMASMSAARDHIKEDGKPRHTLSIHGLTAMEKKIAALKVELAKNDTQST